MSQFSSGYDDNDDTTLSYPFIVSEDLSLNGRLFVSGNVGIGSECKTNPQSALDVTGAIRVSGGITPTYTTPSFSAGQIGYMYQGTIDPGSFAGGSYLPFSSITFLSADIGVWLISAFAAVNTSQGSGFGYVQVRATSGTFAIPNSTCTVTSTMNAASQTYIYNPISFVTKVQGASAIGFYIYPVTTTTMSSGSYLIATRIA